MNSKHSPNILQFNPLPLPIPQPIGYYHIQMMINDISYYYRSKAYNIEKKTIKGNVCVRLKNLYYFIEPKYKISYKFFKTFCEEVPYLKVIKDDSNKHYIHLS